jgi:hypothetical protein
MNHPGPAARLSPRHGNVMLNWLHDDRLRERNTYAVARRASSVIGRVSTPLRIVCCPIFLGADLAAVPLSTRSGWLAVVVVPFIGAVLAIAHTHQEYIEAMTARRFWRSAGWDAS